MADVTSIGVRKPFKLVDQTPTLVNGKSVAHSVDILRGWANVTMKSGFRSVDNNQTSTGKFFEFRFRFRSEITLSVNVKIYYNGQYHTIQSIERDKEKLFYWIVRVESKTFT